jgi:hypothetical protein
MLDDRPPKEPPARASARAGARARNAQQKSARITRQFHPGLDMPHPTADAEIAVPKDMVRSLPGGSGGSQYRDRLLGAARRLRLIGDPPNPKYHG